MDQPRALDDPEQARFAWRRYRRLMRWMTLAEALCVGGALWALARWYGPLHLSSVIATIAGVGGSMLLAGALMGLVFLSSGTGHDAAVDERD